MEAPSTGANRPLSAEEWAALEEDEEGELVDALGTVEIFERNAAGQYLKMVGATAGLLDAVPGCPGFTFDVSALWAELARLGPETDA